MPKNRNTSNRYERKVGHREAVGAKKKSISFSWEKFDHSQGQTIKEWEQNGLLSQFCNRMQQIGQYEAKNALANQFIKQYTKNEFPPNSNFISPKHVSPAYWAVIHITPNSKEVVVGFIEEDVFYIVFLDQHHDFWPTDIQSRNKVKR